MAPHIHTRLDTTRLLRWFVLASIPAALVGVWNLGYQTLAFDPAHEVTAFGGGFALLDLLGIDRDPTSFIACMVLGLGYSAPLLFVSMAVSAIWATVFARLRDRPIDPGWFVNSWLFVLLLPASVSPIAAAVAMSFGVVVGTYIFGGTGRYLVSPALLGVVFLYFSYPGFTQAPLPIANGEIATSWDAIVVSGTAEHSIAPYLLGKELGALGTSSTLVCLLGAALLIYAGAASWRIIAGGLVGILITAGFINFSGAGVASQIPGYWHLALGNFTFALVFLATDPSAAPLTRPARWCYGFIIAMLTILIRTFDPSHPEASLFAVLLGSLTVPLMDYFVVKRYWREPQRS